MIRLYLIGAMAAILLGGGWYIKYLIGENAVLEITIQAERESMQSFANEVVKDIEGYKAAMGALMQGYRRADNEKDRLESVVLNHDLKALVNHRPGLVAIRINDGTAKLFAAIEGASGNTPDTGIATPTKTDTN